MSKHTPGPWVVGNKHMRGGVFAADGQLVAGTHGASRNFDREAQILEQDANARLIAAAPELLTALERLQCEVILSDIDMDYIESHFRPHLDKARAVIAKAKGESA